MSSMMLVRTPGLDPKDLLGIGTKQNKTRFLKRLALTYPD